MQTRDEFPLKLQASNHSLERWCGCNQQRSFFFFQLVDLYLLLLIWNIDLELYQYRKSIFRRFIADRKDKLVGKVLAGETQGPGSHIQHTRERWLYLPMCLRNVRNCIYRGWVKTAITCAVQGQHLCHTCSCERGKHIRGHPTLTSGLQMHTLTDSLTFICTNSQIKKKIQNKTLVCYY